MAKAVSVAPTWKSAPNGDWVSYGDYAELQKEYDALKAKMTSAIQTLEN